MTTTTARTATAIDSATVFSTAAVATAEARKLADNYNRTENRSGNWQPTRNPRRVGNGWSARIEFWETCPQPQPECRAACYATPQRPQLASEAPKLSTSERIKFCLLARRVAKRFAIAYRDDDTTAATRELINATRLWNYADHVADGDALWSILDAFCGAWCLSNPRDVNSMLFTYADSIDVVKWAHTSAALDRFEEFYTLIS